MPPPQIWEESPEHFVEQSDAEAVWPDDGFVEVVTVLAMRRYQREDTGGETLKRQTTVAFLAFVMEEKRRSANVYMGENQVQVE